MIASTVAFDETTGDLPQPDSHSISHPASIIAGVISISSSRFVAGLSGNVLGLVCWYVQTPSIILISAML